MKSKFRMPNKYNAKRNTVNKIAITSKTYLIQRANVKEGRIYDFYYEGTPLDTIKVTPEDEVRKEITMSFDGELTQMFNETPEFAYIAKCMLHAIHPELKAQYEQFITNNK